MDDTLPNPDEEIVFQAVEVTRDPKKLQMIKEHFVPRDILFIKREDDGREAVASLELQKAAYIAVCTEEELNSDQTKFFLDGEISKLKHFEPEFINKINSHIWGMICNRRDGLQDYLQKPDYQTNHMTRQLYVMQSEFLLDLYKSKIEFWNFRTDIYDDSSELSYSDADDYQFEATSLDFKTYGLNPHIQYQQQRIIPAVSMEHLYIE